MSNRTIGLVFIMIGALMSVFSLVADAIGFGSLSGVGWKQLTGSDIGIFIAIVGLWLSQAERNNKK